MSILLVRHGLSEANNRDNIGTLAFAAEAAPLMEVGRQQASEAGKILRIQYGVNLNETAVATSELLRTKETAQHIGFTVMNAYSLLDEVRHDVALPKLRTMLDEGVLPDSVLRAAEDTLSNPPEESIWVSHGLRIAGICALLGTYREERLIPRFCEIREIEL